jgi:hypothetical protein
MNLDPFHKKTDQNLWRALELAHLRYYMCCTIIDVTTLLSIKDLSDNKTIRFSHGKERLIIQN